MPSILHDRRGMTLPLALLVIVLLFVGGIAGLMRVSAERRITANLEAESNARALADAGLARYLAVATAPPAASLGHLLTGLPGGAEPNFVRVSLAAAFGVIAV